jgi:hypothetical protein
LFSVLKSKSYTFFSGTQNSEAATSIPISIFDECPALSIASNNKSIPSVLSYMLGANPPSSPTLVASNPYFF